MAVTIETEIRFFFLCVFCETSLRFKMSSKNDMYRNPPAPLGYVPQQPPEIMREVGIGIGGIQSNCIEFFASSGIFDVPDVSVYDHFNINSSSDEDIVEIPVEQCVKQIESIVLTDEEESVSKLKKDVVPKIEELEAYSKPSKDEKKSAIYSPTHREKTSTPKIKMETEPCVDKSKKKKGKEN